jgi:hypothetical protein
MSNTLSKESKSSKTRVVLRRKTRGLYRPGTESNEILVDYKDPVDPTGKHWGFCHGYMYGCEDCKYYMYHISGVSPRTQDRFKKIMKYNQVSKKYTHLGLRGKSLPNYEIIVDGGGLGNGNEYATVLVEGDHVIYREYGNNPTKVTHRNSTLRYDDEGYRFDIVDA